MPNRNLIIIVVAAVLGLFAVVAANSLFSGVERRQELQAEQQKLSRIVVANQQLEFGTPLNSSNLRLANWPSGSVPTGAFTSLEAATSKGGVALQTIVIGEPVLASKVSGANGRAVLSANLPVGKVAYSIPVTEVAGVAGFVRPGDRVDVILTRQIPGKGADSVTDKMADTILEGVPVLAVGQTLDENATKAEVTKTATLEVDSYGAQKLALGIQLGTLSMALRNVADQATGARSTVVPRNLTASNYYIPEKSGGSGGAMPTPEQIQARAQTVAAAMRPALQGLAAGLSGPTRAGGPTMTVYRGNQPAEYEVQRGR